MNTKKREESIDDVWINFEERELAEEILEVLEEEGVRLSQSNDELTIARDLRSLEKYKWLVSSKDEEVDLSRPAIKVGYLRTWLALFEGYSEALLENIVEELEKEGFTYISNDFMCAIVPREASKEVNRIFDVADEQEDQVLRSILMSREKRDLKELIDLSDEDNKEEK